MFRRGLAAILLLGVSGAAVNAADLDTPINLGPAVVGPRWQGFSFGGYVSGTWSGGQSVSQSWYAPYSGYSSTVPTSFSQGLYGGGAGLQVGYDKQYGQFVTGVMADYGFIGGAKATSNYSGSITWPFAGWSNQAVNGSYTQQLESLGTARWRIGYTPDNDWLIYGDAGLAAGQTLTTSNLQVDNGYAFNGSRSGMAIGYTVGGGVQYSMGPNWSLGLDALYYNLGNRDNVATANFITYGVYPSGQKVVLPSPEISSKGEFSGFQLRLTALYQFDGGSSDAHAYAPMTDPNNEVPITVGVRAGYSIGQNVLNLQNGSGSAQVSRLTYKNADSFTAEPFFNMDIPNWGLYLTGFLGIGQQRNGTLQDEDFTPYIDPYSSTNSTLQDGQLQYGQVDLGWNGLQTAQYRLGAFIGYTFENDNYNAYGCSQTATNPDVCAGGYANTGISSNTLTISDQFTWNAARLGISGAYTIVNGLTISGDAAWLPYIHVNESNNHWLRMPGDFYAAIPGSGTSSDGFQVAAKVDYRVLPGFDIGAGVRYWWMTAKGDFNFADAAYGGTTQSANWSSQRLQAFLETGYHF